MNLSRHLVWLGLTPEPERELPHALALLRSSEPAAERRRLERLILHGRQRDWLRYLAEAAALVAAVADGADNAGGPGVPQPEQREAALLAGEVVLAHHEMLIGLPGSAWARAAADRALLDRALTRLRDPAPLATRTAPRTTTREASR